MNEIEAERGRGGRGIEGRKSMCDREGMGDERERRCRENGSEKERVRWGEVGEIERRRE